MSNEAAIERRTPTESLVASVWCEVLELEEVSVNDNFFRVGGHSLAAVQVMHELSARLGVELELEEFFDLETLKEVAAELDRRQAAAREREESSLYEGEL